MLTGGEVGGTVVSQYPERGLPLEVARRLWRDVARVLRRLELAALLLLTPTVAAAGQGHGRVGRLLGLQEFGGVRFDGLELLFRIAGSSA